MNVQEKAQKQPGRYESLLAHEVRNPLTNITLAAELLVADVAEENHEMYINIIQRNCTRVNELMNELIKWQQERRDSGCLYPDAGARFNT